LPTFKDDLEGNETTEEVKKFVSQKDVDFNMKDLDPNDVTTLLWLGR